VIIIFLSIFKRLKLIVVKMPSFRVAVTSKSRQIIDVHFGHADEFLIYDITDTTSILTEIRKTPKYCSGAQDCADKNYIFSLLSDCDALITKMIGVSPEKILEQRGIRCIRLVDTVENGLLQAFQKLTAE
jgi:nitrogen fixation protein NifB